MPDAIFNGWSGVARVAAITPAAYVALVLILRVSGKRTLAKLNAFDLVVTIAIGSTLGAIITNKSLALTEGLVALGLLVGLQFVVTFAAVRWPWVNGLVTAAPTLLARDGQPLEGPLRRQRITRDELLAAAREAGSESLDDVRAVYLESDGTLTALLAPEGQWNRSMT